MMPLEAVPSGTAAPLELPTLLLSGMIWAPALAAIALLFFPARTDLQRERIRAFALGATGLVLALAVLMWYGFRDQSGTYVFEENRPWLRGAGAAYHLGIDGVSMVLLLLSAFLFVSVLLASTRTREHLKEYLILLLLLETGVNGVFASLDYLLFFMFWQLQAVPMFLLIARFGGPRRLNAAWKLLGAELAGSALLLLAIFILYFKAPVRTFDMATLHDVALPAGIALLVSWLFFIAFAVKLPVFPFHRWFIDGMAESPAPVAMMMAGLAVKLGGYGLIRVEVGEFQEAWHKIVGAVVVIAVVSIIWSAVAAVRTDDLRRLIAYVVTAHMGLVLLAAASAAPVALNGSLLLMMADGLSAAMLVVLAAALADRAGSWSIRAMGGLAARMPRGALLWVLATLAALGFPGLAGFVGQLMVVIGTYPTHRVATPLALLGTLMLAGVLIWTAQRIFFGPTAERHGRVRDLGTLELGNSVALLSLMVLLGVLPAILMDSINFSVLSLLSRGGG
jgi:NADH-quinone oxidoreductase subunit M